MALQRSVPASSFAYAEIRRRIVEGEYPPGHPLGERRLATELRLSRTPIREALRRLEVEGLAQTQPRLGLAVSDLDVDEIVEIYEVREALEGMAARLAATRASPADVAELERLIERMEDLDRSDDIDALARVTSEFHLLLYRSARNRRLFALVKDLHDRVRRSLPTTLAMGERHSRAVEEHRALFEAVRTKDSDLAERLARRHRQNTRRLRVDRGPGHNDGI